MLFLSTPDGPPSEAKDRTESSDFRQCGSSPAWIRKVDLATSVSVTLNVILYFTQYLPAMSSKHQTQLIRINCLLVIPELPSHILCPANVIDLTK